MMKVLVIGDPHFKSDNIQETEQLINEIKRICNNITPNFIVSLGDTLNNHERITISCLNRAERYFDILSSIAPTFNLIGNHDRPNNSVYMTDEHPFNALKRWNNVHIVDTTLKIKVGEFNFLFVPYVPNGRFREAIDNIDLSDVKCIFAHQEFKNCMMGSICSENGDDLLNSNIPILSGHIHEYQELNNVTYVGTPFQHAFGDSADKALMLLTIDDTNLQKERLPITINKKINITISFNQLNKLDDIFRKINNGDKIKINIECTNIEMKSFRESLFYENIKAFSNIKIFFRIKEEVNTIVERKKETLNFLDIMNILLNDDEKEMFNNITNSIV